MAGGPVRAPKRKAGFGPIVFWLKIYVYINGKKLS